MRKAFSPALNGRWEPLLAVLFVLLAIGYAVAKPIWDWDVIPYQALAAHVSGVDWATAHRSAYTLVDGLPDSVKVPLYTLEPFRETVATDPESLRQVSGFYADRIGFYLLLAGLQGIGLPPAWSFTALGLLALCTVAGVTWAWSATLWGRRYALVALVVVLAFPSLMKVYRLSNPDGLVAAMMLLGGWLWLYRKGSYAILAWLVMIVLRPNTAVWLMPLGAALLAHAIRGRGSVMPVIELAALGLAAAALQLWADGYGLTVLLHHTFESPFAYPATIQAAWDWGWHAELLTRRLAGIGGRDFLLFYGMLAAAGVMLWRGAGEARNLGLCLVAGALLMVLLFPGFWERHYAGLVLTVVMCAVTSTSRRHPHGLRGN